MQTAISGPLADKPSKAGESDAQATCETGESPGGAGA